MNRLRQLASKQMKNVAPNESAATTCQQELTPSASNLYDRQYGPSPNPMIDPQEETQGGIIDIHSDNKMNQPFGREHSPPPTMAIPSFPMLKPKCSEEVLMCYDGCKFPYQEQVEGATPSDL